MARTRVPSSQTLPNGLRVRLRLPVSGDARPLGHLIAQTAPVPDDLEVRRLLRFDPRRRVALVAAIVPGVPERIVGFVAGDLHAGALPDLVLADEALAPEVAELLADVFADRVADHLARTA